MNARVFLLISACLGLSLVLGALPPAGALHGILVDDEGRALGTYEARSDGRHAIPEFPYVIRAELEDGRRWVLTPTGVSRPTDTAQAGQGPVMLDVREFAAPSARRPQDRPGMLFLASPLGELMHGQMALRPEPEPGGAHWIYSASFRTVHFISAAIAEARVTAARHYAIGRESSLDLSESHGVMHCVLTLNGGKRAFLGHIHGAVFAGASEERTDPDAVRTQLTVLFRDEGRKAYGVYSEVDEGGRMVGAEHAFAATRSTD